MHILFLTDNFYPEINAPASRTHEHCREWVKSGHKVTVVTGAPNFPKGRVFEGYKNKLWQSESIDGIKVIRVWTYIAKNQGVRRRTADFISYMISGTMASLFVRRVDIIVGTSPQFFTACAAWMVSVLKWKPWVFELRDFWPESIKAVGAVENSKALRILEWIEMFLYRRADKIIPVTHSFKKVLISRGVRPEKICVVTNGVDMSQFTAMPKDQALLVKLGLEGKFVVGYIGTHGMAHGLGTVLDAAKILSADTRTRRAHFLLVGDGAQKRHLIERALEEGIDEVTFVDSVSKSEVVRYWSILDAAVIHLTKKELFKSVIPSKIFECMAMRIPIILGVQGESARIVEKCRAGTTFEPENAVELASQIAERYRRLEDGGAGQPLRHDLVLDYDRSRLAATMLHELESAIDS